MSTPRHISATQLTLMMLALTIVPIGFGLLLYFNSPPSSEPHLPAEMRLSAEWVASDDERRLLPCLVIRNSDETPISKLSVGINDQFYHSGNRQLASKEEVALPLESFISRNGSVRFPVGSRDITKVTVFAQMESGARGYCEFEIPPDSDPHETTWLPPKRGPASFSQNGASQP